MPGKLSASAMLNLGSAATFIAFPLLYLAASGDSPGLLVPGLGLMAFSMLAPFIARTCGQ